MIVQDKVASLTKAFDISSKILSFMAREIKKFASDDDPAEKIYLACHIVGHLNAKVLISLDGYAQTYAIEDLNTEKLKEWTGIITNEYIEEYIKTEADKENEG